MSDCWRSALNYYGQPITPPEYFDGRHVANPGPVGSPPVCSCGWTRHEVDGRWFEMSDHLADMAPTYRHGNADLILYVPVIVIALVTVLVIVLAHHPAGVTMGVA